jgi:branched-chain amino acid transport system permease protein
MVGATALYLVLPHWLSTFRASQFATAGAYFVAIVGLAIVTGFTGQISLGQGALMALGGYTTAILVTHHGVQDVWTIPLAGLVGAAAGSVIGLPALRLSGLYLALATFALAVSMPSLLKKWPGLTGGSGGLNFLDSPHGLSNTTGVSGTVRILGREISQFDFFYYLAWGTGLILLALAWLLLRGRPGRAFRAVRDSEVAATASGISLPLYKTLAFGVSGFYAGVGGALYAIVAEIVNPQSFDFSLSLWLLVGAVVGGLGSLWALALGALFVEFLPVWTDRLSSAPGAPSVFFGAAIIVVMILLPAGAGGLLTRLVRPLTSRPRS